MLLVVLNACVDRDEGHGILVKEFDQLGEIGE